MRCNIFCRRLTVGAVYDRAFLGAFKKKRAVIDRAYSIFFLCLVFSIPLHAETGYDAWLRYAALDDASARQYRALIPTGIVALSDGPTLQSARQELMRGIRGMLGRTLRVETDAAGGPAIVLGTLEDI